MSRGLPWSLLLHVLVLTVVILYGNTVQRTVIEPARYIQARIVTPDVLERETAPEETTEAEPDPTPPPAEPEPLPPKEVPEARPQPEPEPQEPEPQPRQEQRQEEAPAAEAQPATPEEPGPRVSGPSVSGTDADFPFAWYIATVEGQIARNWRPRQLGFGDKTRVSCAVHFVIGRAGTISRVTLVQGSGVGVYDREALRAVQATRLPPLPLV